MLPPASRSLILAKCRSGLALCPLMTSGVSIRTRNSLIMKTLSLNRRQALVAGLSVAAVAVIAGRTEALAADTKHAECAKICRECASECESCSACCKKDRPECSKQCEACQHMCLTCASLCEQKHALCKDACVLCEKMCRACAAECMKQKRACCDECAKKCLACADACKAFHAS